MSRWNWRQPGGNSAISGSLLSTISTSGLLFALGAMSLTWMAVLASLVAAFGVLNILIMAVLERVNDIAILKSFGLSRWDVTLIYLFQGIVIGLIDLSAGADRADREV